MMCVLAAERRVQYVNRVFATFAGIPDTADLSQRAGDVLGCIHALEDPRGCGYGPKCEQCPLRQALEDTSRTGHSHSAIEYHGTMMQGSTAREVTLLGSTARIQVGAESRTLLCLVDITDRQRAEQEIEISRARLRILANRLQTAREEESTRIARTVHDELGQQLTALKMDLRWVERGLERIGGQSVQPVLEKVMSATALVDDTVETVQRIAAELRPAVLDQLGLFAVLRREAGQFRQRAGIGCSFYAPAEETRLSPKVATACFRIVQEALTNILRHAAATAVEIEIQTEPAGFVLEVRDNGRGITAAALDHPDSLGLFGMQERARALGGTVTLAARPGGGTVIRLLIPPGSAEAE